MLGQIHDSDIKLLRIFQVIAECGGFSAAEAQLNVSQSAISTQMAQLEVRLGCRLCERGRGNFELTEDGIAVLEASEKLFAALEDFRNDVAEARGRLTGELRLGLIDNTVTHEDSRIRDAIAAFSEAAPDARINIYVGGAVELEQQVLDGRLHIAVGLFHHQLESIDYIPLFDEEHLLYCARKHPFFTRDDDAITEEEFGKAGYVTWGYVEGLDGWEAPFSFNEVAASPYIEGVTYLILSGKYLGYLPTHYADLWQQRGELRALLPTRLRRSFGFCLVKRKSGRLSNLSRLFLDKLGVNAE